MIDLHVHTTASDGQYNVSEIIEIAKKSQVDVLAITDHDSVSALDEAIELGKKNGILIIPGIEISADYTETMHILGYFVDIKNERLLKQTIIFQKNREDRNRRYIEQFNKMGIKITIEDVLSQSNGAVLAKPHFARALIEKGYIENYIEAFEKFFSLDEFKRIKMTKLSPRESIELILEAGGIPVLAHPKGLKLGYDDLENKILELKSYGLLGLECYYSYNNEEQTAKSLEIAKRNGLLITGGSDFHGEIINAQLKLGTGINGNLNIPKEVVENLIRAKENM